MFWMLNRIERIFSILLIVFKSPPLDVIVTVLVEPTTETEDACKKNMKKKGKNTEGAGRRLLDAGHKIKHVFIHRWVSYRGYLVSIYSNTVVITTTLLEHYYCFYCRLVAILQIIHWMGNSVHDLINCIYHLALCTTSLMCGEVHGGNLQF